MGALCVSEAGGQKLLVAARLTTDAGSPGAFATGQSEAQALVSVNAFSDGWNAALAIFGVHLLLLGYLVLKSGYVPRAIGVLVMIASAGYLMDSFGGLLSTDYNANVALFTFVGEVLLMGWLLWKGAKLRTRRTEPI